MTGAHVTARLATVSALRALCLRLPHVATPAEVELLKRFDALVQAPDRATQHDLDALVAGWSHWWRQGRGAELSAMIDRVDAELVGSDRRLASFALVCSAVPARSTAWPPDRCDEEPASVPSRQSVT